MTTTTTTTTTTAMRYFDEINDHLGYRASMMYVWYDAGMAS